MAKSERFKKLLRQYIEGSIDAEGRERLLFMIHQEQLEDAAFCEQYKIWSEAEGKKKHVPTEEMLGRIKAGLKITEDRLTEDDLKLKGIRYMAMQSSRNKLRVLVRYAAVILITAMAAGIAYYLTGRMEEEEMARNEINVPYGSRIRVTLADSSVVWLNSGSRLSYPERFTQGSREVYLEGEGFFDIRKDRRNPFFVRTSDINIKVLGTRFNVKTYPEEDIIETTLVSGQLLIETGKGKPGGQEVAVLKPSQKVIYSKSTNQLALERKEPGQVEKPVSGEATRYVNMENRQKIQELAVETSWKDNQLIFRDETLLQLARLLERWYNVKIEIMDEEVGKYQFTGRIENETIEQALKALSIASDLDFRIDSNKIEITGKK